MCKQITYLLLFSVMMLTQQLAFTQSIFNNKYDIVKGTEVIHDLFIYNNNYYISGRSTDSTWYLGPTFPKGKISITKIDTNGNTIWKKRYGNNNQDYRGFPEVSITSQGLFYGNGAYSDSLGKAHQYLFKFNEKGDSLLLVHYFENDTTIETYAGGTKITRDNNLILGGVVDSSYYNQFSQMYLMKTDTFGNILWWKTYGGSQYETCTNMDTTSDGGFILGGWTTSFGGADQDPYIVKTDSNGTFQWQKTINSNSFNDWPAVVISTQDGGILAVTTEVQRQDVNNKWVKIFFNKYDVSGNLLWRKNVGDTLWAAPVFSVKEAPNGDIVALGNNQFYDILFKINAMGDSLMMRTIYRIETACSRLSQYGFDLALIDNGGYAIAGFIIPYIPSASINNTQDAWLSTYDSLGCQLQNAPYNLTATVNYAGNDTLVELNWQYNSSNPNELFIVEMYVAEDFVWDIRNDSCLLGPFPTTNHMFVTGTTYTDRLTSITKYKIPYRVFAVDTTNQLMSCHSNIAVVDLTTNITESPSTKQAIKIYPNPNNGNFTLQIETPFTQAALSIYNITGKQILQQNIIQTATPITLSTYPKGLYFYKIMIDNELITGKIIVD